MTRWWRWAVDKKMFEECESGCAYHGITDFVTNMLMKVQHVDESENSVHNSCVPRTVIWTWRFVLSRQTWRNLRHGLRFTRPWFLLQTYCEHWKCVNRRLPCCRSMVWSHDCRHATVTWALLEWGCRRWVWVWGERGRVVTPSPPQNSNRQNFFEKWEKEKREKKGPPPWEGRRGKGRGEREGGKPKPQTSF